MAPRRREKNTTSTAKTATIETRRITRSIYKKQQMLEKSSKMIESLRLVDEEEDDSSTKIQSYYDNEEEGCSTPKSEKYKIPEIKTCPPAPKKPRRSKPVSVSTSSKNFLVQRRRPITFFNHPDLDKFFTFASRDHIKV